MNWWCARTICKTYLHLQHGNLFLLPPTGMHNCASLYIYTYVHTYIVAHTYTHVDILVYMCMCIYICKSICCEVSTWQTFPQTLMMAHPKFRIHFPTSNARGTRFLFSATTQRASTRNKPKRPSVTQPAGSNRKNEKNRNNHLSRTRNTVTTTTPIKTTKQQPKTRNKEQGVSFLAYTTVRGHDWRSRNLIVSNQPVFGETQASPGISRIFIGLWQLSQEEGSGFASLGSAQDSHHHDDMYMLPVENGCGHISLHKAKNNYI